MKIKFMVAATLMAALVTTTSCGNSFYFLKKDAQ